MQGMWQCMRELSCILKKEMIRYSDEHVITSVLLTISSYSNSIFLDANAVLS